MGLCCCKIFCDKPCDVDASSDRDEQDTAQSTTPVVVPVRPTIPWTSAASRSTFEIRNERVRSVQVRPPTIGISTNRGSTRSGNESQRAVPVNSLQPILDTLTREHARLLEGRQNVVTNSKLLMRLLKTLKVHHAPFIPSNVYQLEELDQKSQNFVTNRLFKNNKFDELYRITRTVRVWNPYLMTQYALNKLKYGEKFRERHFYHGTGIDAVKNILTNNFDWRKVTQGWFGKGVYFGNNPYYATHYSKKRQSGTNPYVMIVAKVLVEDGSLCVGSRDTGLPAIGHTTISTNGQEYIKYEDAMFYPEFVVYFRPIDTFH